MPTHQTENFLAVLRLLYINNFLYCVQCHHPDVLVGLTVGFALRRTDAGRAFQAVEGFRFFFAHFQLVGEEEKHQVVAFARQDVRWVQLYHLGFCNENSMRWHHIRLKKIVFWKKNMHSHNLIDLCYYMKLISSGKTHLYMFLCVVQAQFFYALTGLTL